MNMDKENCSVKGNSKIPVPVEPLPALPQHVLKRPPQHGSTCERPPLKTINATNINGTSQNYNTGTIRKKREVKTKTKYNLNTKHVTVRQNTEDLDWDFKVFKDKTVNENIVTVIRDDECPPNESLYFIQNEKNNYLGDTKKVVTPTFQSPSLDCSRIKNIKKSLKRPHSRELQGLSPMAKQRRGDERHKRRLIFNDSVLDTLQSPDYAKKSLMTCLNRDYTEDLFTYLLNTEKKSAVPRISSITRACLINWLMKVNGSNGNPAIVQTARWYFDSVLAVGHIHVDKLQLVAAACYWIAQKINGHAYTSRKLVKCSCEAFTTGQLMAAEKAILTHLKFPSQPVIPQEYITYLSWCCDNSHPGEIEVAATFLCISGLMVDKALSQEWPSVIGAASVRNALLLLRRKDCLAKLQTNPVFQGAIQKTSNISNVCSKQRRAILFISSSYYEYKAPIEHFGIPPYFIAQKIISSANILAIVDKRRENESIK